MIELLVFDVDGTLTNGDITYSSGLEEFKTFNVNDGFAIVFWTKHLGKKAAIITGRESKIVEYRANELKIEYLYQNVKDKLQVLDEILKKEGLNYNQVAAIGDDLNDLKMLKKAGLSFAPQNAHELIKNSVNVVCKKSGGSGAAREMIEYILKEDGLEEEFFHALSGNAGITLHLIQDRGRNKHHIIEATFKAFAVALRRALVKNEKLGIPSTKGVL